MDINNPYAESPKKPSPGEKASHDASIIASFIEAIGGPKLNQEALAIVLTDLQSWWSKWASS